MGVVAILIATGTIGYKLILGLPWFDCFYFTLITITTIGFGEPEGMTEQCALLHGFSDNHGSRLHRLCAFGCRSRRVRV